jgi:hypothetical protein
LRSGSDEEESFGSSGAGRFAVLGISILEFQCWYKYSGLDIEISMRDKIWVSEATIEGFVFVVPSTVLCVRALIFAGLAPLCLIFQFNPWADGSIKIKDVN